MPSFSIPYGNTTISGLIPDSFIVDILLPPISSIESDEHLIVREAINHPIGTFSWKTISPSGSVAIAINDKTRPVPNSILVPALLEKLDQIGLNPDQITFYIATGTHIPMEKEEFGMLLPVEVVKKYRIVSHDCDNEQNLTYLGETKRKTPVYINSLFYKSDYKFLIGNIEPHHFMGYSGGAKTASIGLTGRQTINRNHAMLVEPESTFGVYRNNPTRQDVEEIGDLIKVDAALNVVMNSSRQIMHAVFGSTREVMLTGIPLSRKICQTIVTHSDYDLVIASPGGYPKDINLYQSQKALSHAASITRDGGCVILVAECKEGVGSNSYEAFMEGITTTDSVFSKLQQEGFKVGPHKALQFAREQRRIRIIVVSSIGAERLTRLLLEPSSSLEDACKIACTNLPENAKIAIMPKATNTIPSVEINDIV